MLLSDVHCTGTEQNLHFCPSIKNTKCNGSNSAGVICLRDFGKYHNLHTLLCPLFSQYHIYVYKDIPRKCTSQDSAPPQSQNNIVGIERYLDINMM